MVVDGIELLRMIRDGEIKNGTKFKNPRNKTVFILENDILYRVRSENLKDNIFGGNVFTDIEYFGNYKFEILSEEDEEIDIQAIKLMKHNLYETGEEEDIKGKINDLIKTVKQLDNKLKEKE